MRAAAVPDSLTRSVEDYLKAIYQLSPEGRPASTSEIASLLALSPPSVTGMVKRLSEHGLLEHVPYRGVQLTEQGRRAALRMVRRHRLIEAYLVEFLGYSWDTVHEEAERLEHAASDQLVDRMAVAIGEPKVDPHGAPIPTRDGAVDETEYTSLAELAIGVPGLVLRVADEDPAMLRYLAELSVVPGKRIIVKAREPYGGPITLAVGRQEISIGPALAAHVLTAPVTGKASGGRRG